MNSIILENKTPETFDSTEILNLSPLQKPVSFSHFAGEWPVIVVVPFITCRNFQDSCYLHRTKEMFACWDIMRIRHKEKFHCLYKTFSFNKLSSSIWEYTNFFSKCLYIGNFPSTFAKCPWMVNLAPWFSKSRKFGSFDETCKKTRGLSSLSVKWCESQNLLHRFQRALNFTTKVELTQYLAQKVLSSAYCYHWCFLQEEKS